MHSAATCLALIDKYKIIVTKECMLQRLRARVAEEALRVPEQHVLMDGILFVGVIGHVHDEHIVLSAALGGESVFRRTPTQLRASVAPRRGPAADWRRPARLRMVTTCLLVLRWFVQEEPGPSGWWLCFEGVQWHRHLSTGLGILGEEDQQ
jgi:hypothetical protein